MSLFGNRIARPIGAADMEFYESGLTIRLAIVMAGVSEDVWNGYQTRTKAKWLDRAAKGLCDILNEKPVATKLSTLAANLASRA